MMGGIDGPAELRNTGCELNQVAPDTLKQV